MRALINGTTLTIDLIHKPDDVLRIVGLALKAGLTTIDMHHGAENGMTLNIAPAPDAFAADPLAGLLYTVAEIQGTTPEKLIETWRTRSGVTDPQT